MEAVREQISKTFTQFELTKHLLQNLKKFNLTPVAKLVLLELSSHYNEEKNNKTGNQRSVYGIGVYIPQLSGFPDLYADSRYHFFIPELQPMELHGGLGCDQVHRT